jgi:hypothetical protein
VMMKLWLGVNLIRSSTFLLPFFDIYKYEKKTLERQKK